MIEKNLNHICASCGERKLSVHPTIPVQPIDDIHIPSGSIETNCYLACACCGENGGGTRYCDDYPYRRYLCAYCWDNGGQKSTLMGGMTYLVRWNGRKLFIPCSYVTTGSEPATPMTAGFLTYNEKWPKGDAAPFSPDHLDGLIKKGIITEIKEP
jgi:hypothetical protein